MQWFIFEWVNIYIYIYTQHPLCKPGRERRRPCACAIHLQPGRGGVCVSSLLWLLREATERLDRLWVLLDGRGAHSSTRCSLSTVGLTAEWFVLSSLQTPQKSLDLSLLTKKKSPGGWFVCVIISAWSGGKRWRYSLCIGKSLHFYSEKQNLEILLLQQFIVIYLLTT